MAGEGEEPEVTIPTYFSDCVSRDDLEVSNKLLLEKLGEAINKSVHDAFIAMDLGKTYERLDR